MWHKTMIKNILKKLKNFYKQLEKLGAAASGAINN